MSYDWRCQSILCTPLFMPDPCFQNTDCSPFTTCPRAAEMPKGSQSAQGLRKANTDLSKKHMCISYHLFLFSCSAMSGNQKFRSIWSCGHSKPWFGLLMSIVCQILPMVLHTMRWLAVLMGHQCLMTHQCLQMLPAANVLPMLRNKGAKTTAIHGSRATSMVKRSLQGNHLDANNWKQLLLPWFALSLS